MSKFRGFLFSCLVGLTLAGNVRAQGTEALILYDASTEYGWIGGLHARMLANLLGHFDLPYKIQSVESYQAGQINAARASFYFGSVYDNPLPAAFKTDVLTGTNRFCWLHYNLWQLAGAEFNAKFGFQFVSLDASGYSNIVYKGETFLKNQLDPELGVVSILNSNQVHVPVIARKANGTSVPYAVQSGNFWFISDTPFNYISEEDRYIIFADLLHDILGINHPESHSAVIRIEDVGPSIYPPEDLRAVADLLKAESVPFAIALVPMYRDPLGAYNNSATQHRMSDAGDAASVSFVSAIRYMLTNGAQLLLHGYTHQYGNVINPYTGVSGDDFEFWRETFSNPNTFTIDIYAPVPEDSAAWALGRMNSAKAELANLGMSAVGWEFPHYAASAIDSKVAATNFPFVMNRVLYFDDAGHVAGQFFPYVINRDIYGQKIIPENIGNIEPEPWADYPPRLAADLIRSARKNLVVRDGWASGYYHPFFSLNYLRDTVRGIKALGYTYVTLPTNSTPPVVNHPPAITGQPQSLTNNTGTAAGFSVTATGTAPLRYRWRFNGATISGATNASYNIASVQTNNAGAYTVVVTNNFGAVTSAVANLVVPPVGVAPGISSQPQNLTNNVGTAANFSVTATGTAPLRYQWRRNGANLGGATNSSFNIASVQTNNAGAYTVVVTNNFGTVTSAVANLVVPPVGVAPGISGQPQSLTNNTGTAANFSVTATGTAPLRYQWRRNGANLGGATNSSFNIASVQANNAGAYTVVVTNNFGAVTSAVANLVVPPVGVAPGISGQPQSLTNNTGTAANFSVTATGTAPLRYQWRRNGANLGGATNASYSIASVQTNNAGAYTVVVTNNFGAVTSAVANLVVIVPPPVGVAPGITGQPQSLTNNTGTAANFSVTATGTAPLRYQWRRNGANLGGATNSSFNIASVQTNNAGAYTVVVTNNFGAVTSAVANLVVVVPPQAGNAPVITVQPQSQTNAQGVSTTFSVTATGAAPLSYQWYRNGVVRANAKSATLTLNANANNAGNFTVVIANNFGAVTSAVAVLAVGAKPTIVTPPQALNLSPGQTATFSVTAGGVGPFQYQWRLGGNDIAGATNVSYTIPNVTAANNGQYRVQVVNIYGSVLSPTARLRVR